jgi:4-hydroxy-tetrahydrodipicolinate synthase
MNELRGTGVALVTPFDDQGLVDYHGLEKLLSFTGAHVDYFVVMGTTGESATCTTEEKAKVLAFCKAHNPRQLPIVYGIGGNNTAAVVAEIENTDLEGVSAILSASPYYNKPSQRGIISHYEAIADASPLPIILYNVPGRTASNLEAATTLQLAGHPNIIGIKEASGDLEQCLNIAKAMPSDFFITSGDDLLSTKLIEMGAQGVISVLANGFPESFSTTIQTALNGDFGKSQLLMDGFSAINPLMYEESNPVGIKAVLSAKGICGDQVRLPLLAASEALKAQIKALL